MKLPKLSAKMVIALAAVLGLAAGAGAVYVTFGGSDNPEPQPDPRAIADAQCAAKNQMASASGGGGGHGTASDAPEPKPVTLMSLVAEAAKGEVAGMLPPGRPQSVADLAFDGPDGKPTSLDAFTGRIALVNLWATWCAPCRAEMPALDALQKEMGGVDFEVVAVNVEGGDDVKPKKFLEDTKVHNLGFYRDDTLGMFNEMKKRNLAFGLPVTMLVDRDGCLLAHMNGPAEWASADAKHMIEVALAGLPAPKPEGEEEHHEEPAAEHAPEGAHEAGGEAAHGEAEAHETASTKKAEH
ncbi:MAG: TlpA family protein disulfide reductase [Rhizobiaceae bacterium]|nr:TlpA family protein disulfide reductase [Rhizobiaceae bacterium]